MGHTTTSRTIARRTTPDGSQRRLDRPPRTDGDDGVAAAAASVIALAGAGIMWLAPESTSVQLDDVATTVTSPSTTQGAAATPVPPDETIPTGDDEDDDAAAAADTIAQRLADADPWTAARLVWIEAQYSASPSEVADLMVANEMTSRACYVANGVDVGAIEPGRLAEWERAGNQDWERRVANWTPAGHQRARDEGFFNARDWPTYEPDAYSHLSSPALPACYPAATGVTYLGGPVVWSEDQLASRLMDDEELRQWAPFSQIFGRLPGTEDAGRLVDRCMTDRGWSEWGSDGAAYRSLYLQPTASPTEIDQANDHVDCLTESDAATIHLEASAQRVEVFRVEFATEIEQIERERAVALDKAHEVLHAAGLDPLSD